ncbi:proline and serine-rich protein 3 isoform X1 [Ascaphus truei]|uniref:proline and serine-rich protein 3 isoform X1 n=3 Tax=Ascaphus truei TaxID=8439 RepID=UPI003F596401
MNSSNALFSNQGNPFPAPAKTRTHYHPSQSQPLSAEQKQTILSPARLGSLPPYLKDALSPPDLSFLGGSQQLVPGLPESDSSGPFDESWPSSEGSSSKTPERDERQMTTGTGLMHIQRDYRPTTYPSSEASVIASYMARFRSGRPTSRQERSPPNLGMKDFWWLQTSPDSPDAERYQSTEDRAETGLRTSSGFSPQHVERTASHGDGSLSDSKLYSEDLDIMALQERAGKLVLRSESSLSSVGPVSSDGLGSSPLSSISNPESVFGRSRPTMPAPPPPALVAPIHRPATLLAPPSMRAPPVSTPEQDILYQWRLRRKMEQAREGSLPLASRRRTTSPPVRIPKQAVHTPESVAPVYHGQLRESVQGPGVPSPCREQGPIPSPSPASFPIASPTLAPHTPTCPVPPHMHLLCDILPCIQSHHSSSCAAQRLAKKDGVSSGRSRPDVPAAAAPAAEQRERNMVSDRELQPVSPPQHPHKKVPGRIEQAEERRAKSRREKTRRAGSRAGQTGVTVRDGEQARPESHVHRAIGEVISGRLFSPLESPKHKTVFKRLEQATPLAEPTNRLQPLELAAQLLGEAEDSDGTEFEDDPLLQVLREQREVLRMRLWAVDLRVTELESQNRDDPSH